MMAGGLLLMKHRDLFSSPGELKGPVLSVDPLAQREGEGGSDTRFFPLICMFSVK